MKTIMLVCSAGMSTSLLMNKMRDAAKAYDEEYEIFAVPLSGVPVEVSSRKIDVMLIGPQVRFKLNELKSKYAPEIKIEAIDMQDYGMMRGENVLKRAIELMS